MIEEKINNMAEEGGDEELDEAMQAFAEYLPGMEIGETRTIGLEEFRTFMHVIRADLNLSGHNAGEIKGDAGTYAYQHINEESDVVIIRKA